MGILPCSFSFSGQCGSGRLLRVDNRWTEDTMPGLLPTTGIQPNSSLPGLMDFPNCCLFSPAFHTPLFHETHHLANITFHLPTLHCPFPPRPCHTTGTVHYSCHPPFWSICLPPMEGHHCFLCLLGGFHSAGARCLPHLRPFCTHWQPATPPSNGLAGAASHTAAAWVLQLFLPHSTSPPASPPLLFSIQ